MTSTVLDVTVLLLCVSASVVALGASGGGGPEGPTATDAADRLVTVTATVSYPDADAPNETRRVHATRAELLALAAARDAEGEFDRGVVESVRTGVGPRTRIDATVRRVDERDAEDGVFEPGDGGSRGPPGAPTIQGRAAPSPHSVADEPVPTRGDIWRDQGDDSGDSGKSVTVGPEPPRDADVDVAVVRQPIPDRFGGEGDKRRSSEGVVRIVVRRW